MNENWKDFIKDAKEFDLSSFKIQDTLNPKFWENDGLKPEIKKKLMKIVEDFFESLEIDGLTMEDVTLTGSLANYNWSSYSDVDLHILVDFDDLEGDEEFIKDYFRAKQSVWNRKHDIKMFGHEVEIYVQDANEPHVSTGVYSVMRDSWLVEPKKEDPKIDYETVVLKATSLMDQIDRACDLYCDKKYTETVDYVDKMKEKIRNFRKCGLESGGQFAPENLAFKVLRRNGYLKKLSDLMDKSYDKSLSMDGNFQEHWKNFKREMDEDFQQAVKRGHSKMKKKLVGGGEEPNSPPYSKKPSYKRGPAPVGFGGSL